MLNKVLVLFLLMAVCTSVYAKNRAVIIGIQNYDFYTPLPCCHGDADDMKFLLNYSGFEDDYTLLFKDDYKTNNMLTASRLFKFISDFSRTIRPDDRIIFYFSGRAFTDDKNTVQLFASDANIETKMGILDLSGIRNMLKQNNPKEVVIIIDAARPIIQKKDRDSGREMQVNLKPGKGVKIREDNPAELRSAARRSDERGTIVKTIFSCGNNEKSIENINKNNGAFTYYFTYMKESSRALPQMDKNNDLKISIEELTAYAEIKIAEYADQKGVNRMTPVYMADGDVEYSHFNLFSYKKDEKANEVENRKSELDIAAEAMSEIEAEAANRPKTEIDNSYLDEKLPVFTYKSDDEEVIDYSKMKNTKIENWREVYAKQQELERKRKDEEERKRKEEEKRKYEEAKEKYSSEMRQWYQTELQKCQNEQDIQRKLDALNKMQEKIKASSAFPEISSQYPNMLAPYIQSAEEAKIEMEATIKKREGDFKAELGSMEKMVKSKLRQNIQQKYLEAFKNKWLDYAGKIQSRGLVKRFNKLLALNIALPKIKHGVTDEIDLGGGVKLEMVFIEGRNFNMGSNNGSDDEKPVHRVTLDDFYIGKYEVTQEQWEAVMGENHSEFKGNNLPVEQVSWEDCQEFIEKINEITGMKLRLPTEAEWEYAAKGGQEYEYSGSDDLDEVGWYSSNSGNRTNSVGQKRSNGYGLYDMSGNVCEWCQDWYQEDYYSNSLTDNPNGPQFGSGRVLRGGGWYDGGDDYCRVASRDGNGPSYRGSNYGFRLVSAVRLD